jgi:hypothetical protein
MQDLTEVQVLSSIGELEDFKESTIWADFKRELKAWKEGFEAENLTIVDNAASENPSTANVLLHLGDINGRVKAVNYMLSLPDVFISIIEGQKDTNINEEKEVSDGE